MKKLWILAVVPALLVAVLPGPASAQVPQGEVTDLPVLSREVPAGSGTYVTAPGPAPEAKTVDGSAGDWVGIPSRYGGTVVYSGGELVYQDHLFDAHGADDGRDASRMEKTDPLEEAAPETYRLDALAQADPAGELGIPVPEDYAYDDTYGDASPHQDRADLSEVRVAVAGDHLELLARTTTMTAPGDTAVLVLADTVPGTEQRSVPFNSNLTTTTGDVAFFVMNGVVRVADLVTGGDPTTLAGASAVADPSGWNNALEASLPLAQAAGVDGSVSLAVASGTPDEAGNGFAPITLDRPDETPDANVANVAFRFDEPVRTWFEKRQGLSLNAGTIDPFFLTVDAARLSSSDGETYVPGHGYHDRIFVSDPSTGVPQERGRDGALQHYGVYLPEEYTGEAAPLQWWLHWRGGNAHTAGGVIPKMFKQLGEDRATIVVSPSGRGTGTWYNGRGHVDVLQVWADVFDTFAIDRDHVYVTGHSMGGWGSYLLSVLYPDRFAAAAPFAGPVTQGAWTGADFEGCDDMKFDEYTPCYIEANGSRPRDQHTRKILENVRHVPFGIFHGTDDELVPYSGIVRQAERFTELGYRHRLYTSPGYEHYSHPIMDQWAEAGDYLHSFTRPENPARVTYKRDMPFERATEEVQAGPTVVDFSFDSAYWMSGLAATDKTNGVASFDGRSLALADEPFVVAPDSDAPVAPGQTGPFVITGLQWLDNPASTAPATVNGFDVTLSGAEAVRLDLERMAVDTATTVLGTVASDSDLTLRLDGGWSTAPVVTIDDAEPVSGDLRDGVLTIALSAGSHTLSIEPGTVGPEEVATSVAFTDASDDSAQYSDQASLEALLTNAAGAPIAGEQLTFTLGSESATVVTDASGIASAALPVTETPGEHHATVSFAGREGSLSPSIGSSPFVVNKEDSSIDLVVTGSASARALRATLTDLDAGSPIAGRTISFFVKGTEIGTDTTDESGVATLAVPARYSSKKTTFQASFAGDALYLTATDSTGA